MCYFTTKAMLSSGVSVVIQGRSPIRLLRSEKCTVTILANEQDILKCVQNQVPEMYQYVKNRHIYT